ncbi:MAG TPA: hypothetical protein PL033_07520 [Candidatus Brocadiia bacterium]|nr:hypothetical protein [Candidatus Brocadiia bacterium]
MKIKPRKTLDTLALKDKIQAHIREEIKGMSAAEELEYYHRAAEYGPLSDLWRRLNGRVERKGQQICSRKKRRKCIKKGVK